ncbi:MAG: methylornithine synthase PylB [Desulfobacterales bacterium]|nr:methylornithine synthase PylB [Desulfobacterales bacterium]
MTVAPLKKAEKGDHLNREDIQALLALNDPADLSRLFSAARRARYDCFGKTVFLYGFLYFSTHCRNNCHFCQYRKDNTSLARYRKNLADTLKAAKQMAQTGVHLIDLTMGEDPQFHRTGFQPLVNLVRAVKRETGLPVMVSPGVVPDSVVKEIATSDAQWLACYQETHNKSLYTKLRPAQDYDLRMACKQTAAKKGLLVEEGLLTGVGETLNDLADSIITMRDMSFDQVRVMTFVPQSGTPMSESIKVSRLMEQKVIAVMRLAMPDRLIPASLDVDGLDGLKARLDAGANVVTSIVPPAEGLAGVANNSLDIEDARRSVDFVSQILKDCGLCVASQNEYEDWIRQRKQLQQTSRTKMMAAGAA